MANQTPRHNFTISRILVGGTARMLVRAALQNRVENCISPARLDELRDVLGHRKFRVTAARATASAERAAHDNPRYEWTWSYIGSSESAPVN